MWQENMRISNAAPGLHMKIQPNIYITLVISIKQMVKSIDGTAI